MGVRSSGLRLHGDDFAWSLLDAAPDAMLIVDRAGEIVFVNDHAGRLFGVALDDLLGRSVEDLLPEALRSAHRADRTRYRAEPTVRAMGADLDLWALRANGSVFPVEISLSPLVLGDDELTVAAVRDITERVHAEDQLHRVLRTLDASDDGVFIVDANTLRYSFVSEGAVRLAGYTQGDLLAMGPLHLDPNDTETDFRALVGSLLADPSSSIVRQTTVLRKDGTEVPVETTYRSAPVDVDGNSWIITLARDITVRLAIEAALLVNQQALKEAEQVLAVAEDRERIARDLHDTVIQRLFGEGLNLQAAMAGSNVPEQTRARLQSTIDGLDQTIKDLRMAIFSLQGSGSAPGGLRGRLLAIVNDASRGLGFEARLQFDGPIESIADEIADELTAVIREALANVARHAAAGRVRVTITAGHEVVLTVTDDGVGVPDEVLGGRGMANMDERARRLGGQFAITSQTTGGSMLRWMVPTSPTVDAAQTKGDMPACAGDQLVEVAQVGGERATPSDAA
jgi:PAS domain S-box-containing protein